MAGAPSPGIQAFARTIGRGPGTPGGATVWGGITGDINDQADLIAAIAAASGGGARTISQSGHGFEPGMPVGLRAAGWTAADRDSDDTLADAIVTAIGAGGAGDGHFLNVVSLLHFDGADHSTTFTDVTGKVWTKKGTTEISTAQSKFGGSALLPNGGGGGSNVGITTPSHADFDFGTNDFTIEWWMNIYNFTDFQTIFDRGHNAAGSLLIQKDGGSILKVYIGGSLVLTAASGQAVADSGFEHYALVKDAGTLRLYRGGVQMASAVNGTSIVCVAQLAWGAYVNGTYGALAYIDDARITKSICRYPSGTTFTPPVAVFADALSGSNTFDIVDRGLVTLTTAEWDDRTGDTGGLVKGDYYWLGDTAGTITNVQPSSNPQCIGKAESTTVLNVMIGDVPLVEAAVSGGGGGTYPVAQTAHGLPIGAPIYFSGDDGVLADADTAAQQADGIVTEVVDANNFKYAVVHEFEATAEEWDLRTGNPGGIDLLFANVKTLLHLNGTNGSTVITDDAPAPFTYTAFGNAALTTGQVKYGTAAVTFDGTGDYLRTPRTNDLDPGAGDFTIDFWIRPTATGLYPSFICGTYSWGVVDGGAQNSGWGVFYDNTRALQFSYGMGAGATLVFLTAAAALTLNVWQHVEVTRISGMVYCFVNGTLIHSVANTDNITYPKTYFYLGGYNRIDSLAFHPDTSMQGQLDDFRFTKGAGRHSAAFTAPTAQVPDGSSTGIGLTPNQYYYLSSTPGRITETAPTSGYSQVIGKALSATKFLAFVSPPNAVTGSAGSGGYPVFTDTWNPSDKDTNVVLSNGNLTATVSAGGSYHALVRSNYYRDDGLWYFEIVIDATASPQYFMLGLSVDTDALNNYPGAQAFGGTSWYGADGVLYRGNAGMRSPGAFGAVGDVLGFAYAPRLGRMWVSKNGVWLLGGSPSTLTKAVMCDLPSAMYPYVAMYTSGATRTITARFARASLQYPIPTGFRPWNND
jgi:hypothetical protein